MIICQLEQTIYSPIDLSSKSKSEMLFQSKNNLPFHMHLVNLPLHEFSKQFLTVLKGWRTSEIKYMKRFFGLTKLTV